MRRGVRVQMDLKSQIRGAARELGFDLCGVTTADPPPHAAAFRDWLAGGNHGEMGYMARRVERRTDLQNILSGARSVIVAGMNYNPPPHVGGYDLGNSPRPEERATGVIAR